MNPAGTKLTHRLKDEGAEVHEWMGDAETWMVDNKGCTDIVFHGVGYLRINCVDGDYVNVDDTVDVVDSVGGSVGDRRDGSLDGLKAVEEGEREEGGGEFGTYVEERVGRIESPGRG